jgi:hypothetical protein
MWKMVRMAALIFASGCLYVLCEAAAQTYRCSETTGHCVGIATWQEQPEYFGAYTDVMQAPMHCPKGCGGFVDNEIWLVDFASDGCTSNKYGWCWVEAGTAFPDGEDRAYYFWADGRPLKSSTYNFRFLGPADDVGVTSHYMLLKDARESKTDVFQVWVYNDSFSTLYNGTSTNNAMRGNRIIIGQELAGTQNASADPTNFSRNIWAVQALGQEYVFWYKAQTTRGVLGMVRSDNPPSAEWTIDPAKPPPEGGQLTTWCCN